MTIMFLPMEANTTSVASLVHHVSVHVYMKLRFNSALALNQVTNLQSIDISLQECKVMCAECLPQCDGCGLSLIPSNVKHGKQEPGPSRYGSNKENTINLTSDGEKASSNGRDRGEESSNTSKVATDDMEDSDKEIVIEKDGLTQRYHRRCILKCACCRNIIQKKSDRLYKKQVLPSSLSSNSPIIFFSIFFNSLSPISHIPLLI